ncbi:MAG: hypothetical protein ABWY11_15855 [Umezawaea sp.]
MLDTTCLAHFGRIDRLDVLGDLLSGRRCWTTTAVREELRRGPEAGHELGRVLDLPWLPVVPQDDWDHIMSFSRWVERIGSTERNIGEATVFAAAEVLEAVAITDDRNATAVARSYGLRVHGTIWLLAQACLEAKLTETGAANLVDMLRGSGMRLPCSGADFPAFARKHGIL